MSKETTKKRILLVLCAALCALALSACKSSGSTANAVSESLHAASVSPAAPSSSPSLPESIPPTPEAASPVPETSVSPSPEAENTPDIPTQPLPLPTPTPTPEAGEADMPEATPETPESFVKPSPLGLAESDAVDDSFFADAAFFGNSLVDGLRIFGGISQGDFIAATSASVVNVEVTQNAKLASGEKCTLFASLTEKQYGKIYVLLGINEISFDTPYFIKLYSGLLSRISASEPDAEIYVMSLTPVTRETSGESDFFNMERISAYNSAMCEMAEQNGYRFIDLSYALSGDDGFLPDDDSTDGIHLVPEKYAEWSDCLRTHHA